MKRVGGQGSVAGEKSGHASSDATSHRRTARRECVPGRRRQDPDRLAGWRVDPSGVYPFRFHNGTRWTEVVLTRDGRIRHGGAC